MMSIQLRSRDKLAIGGALAILSVVAWMSTLYQARMTNMGPVHENMAGMGLDITALAFLLYLTTWTVMMTAMMLPSAGPMIMTYATLSQRRRSRQLAYASTGLFVLGYLLAWGGTGLVAYAISVLSPIVTMVVPELEKYAGLIGGAVLVMAGMYQFSPLKNICLSNCRTPLGYVMTHWREGRSGALLMGLHHGLYCIGCCWALMAILFVVGVMNLAWMALLSLFMFIEKVSARGLVAGKIVGILLIAAGVAMVAHSIL